LANVAIEDDWRSELEHRQLPALHAHLLS
jgi:hypothetical protein